MKCSCKFRELNAKFNDMKKLINLVTGSIAAIAPI